MYTEPNIVFSEVGLGNYRIVYTVQEGDTDVGPGELIASITLASPSGNIGIPNTLINNIENLTIDAHAPVVNRIEVSSLEVGVGQTVQVAITADETGYTAIAGTLINGIPLSSSRVSFSERSGGLYELSYVVGAGDANVAPGNLQITMVMSDPAGNINLPFNIVESNSLEIYTELPTAVIAGTPEICEGESGGLAIFLQGRGPWDFELYDGSTITDYTDIASNSYSLDVAPDQTTTYSILTVRDVNGVVNSGSGTVQVTVNSKTFVEIINLASGYSFEADPVKLEANVPGGTFSGPGVVSATGYFNPGVADTLNSPHTIYYNYVNANGCNSEASALVFVLGASGDIFMPSDFVCTNGAQFTVNASNGVGVNGSFRLLNSISQPVSGLNDQGDNTAVIDPVLLTDGTYTIEYQYFDLITHYLRKDFVVESVSVPVILNLSEASYCQNAVPFILQANIDNVIFSGPGVSSTLNGYLFNPGDVDRGDITIVCESISEHGCSESTERSTQILSAPLTSFALSPSCIPEGGGNVTFTNSTPEKLLVESWNWDFDDPASGENNFSTDIDPEHVYSTPGNRTITLTTVSVDGCIDSYIVDTLIGIKPVADFNWISECFSLGSGVKFINKSTSGSVPIDSLIWTFKTGDGGILETIHSSSATDTIAYMFDAVDNYQIDLVALNSSGCSGKITKELQLKPTVLLKEKGYYEDFDESDGMWKVQSDNQVESWVLDVPDFVGFNSVSGDNAWFTQFPSGVVGYKEESWIESPCFDFSGISRPLIQMEIMRSFVPNLNGAVLQYQDVVEEGWKTVGSSTPGVGWYNAFNLINKPGGSSIGWGLNVFNPDTEWVRASHSLDELIGKSSVTFRIALASTGAQGIGNQGFAFDNVSIAERTKMSVLEYFTNASSVQAVSTDKLIDSLGIAYSKDIIDLQYHMDYPGIDPMNLNNPVPASTRSFYYGIQGVPYAILDGGLANSYRFDFSDLKTTPVDDYIGLATLEIPQFEIELSVDWLDDVWKLPPR